MVNSKYERTTISFVVFVAKSCCFQVSTLKKSSSLFAKSIVTLGSNLEFESNVHLGLFRTQRFGDLDPCVNPQVLTLPTQHIEN